jgi:hypothetical protein
LTRIGRRLDSRVNEPFGLAHNVEVSERSPSTSTRLFPFRADSAAAAAESAGGSGGVAAAGVTTAADSPSRRTVTNVVRAQLSTLDRIMPYPPNRAVVSA